MEGRDAQHCFLFPLSLSLSLYVVDDERFIMPNSILVAGLFIEIPGSCHSLDPDEITLARLFDQKRQRYIVLRRVFFCLSASCCHR